jgi:WhiB family redox-sensing transcriptional regulator
LFSVVRLHRELPATTRTQGVEEAGRVSESSASESPSAQPSDGVYPLLYGLAEEVSWQERALCAQTDPESFFPEKGGSTREAKRVCLSCEVRSECLDYALSHDERFGIWGGLSERERRRLKKRAV